MLVIRDQQLTALGAYARRGFEVSLAMHLREVLPQRVGLLRDDSVRAIVSRAVDRAATHGVFAEADVAMFAELLLTLGDDFDVQAPAAEIYFTSPSPKSAAAPGEFGTRNVESPVLPCGALVSEPH